MLPALILIAMVPRIPSSCQSRSGTTVMTSEGTHVHHPSVLEDE
jgi:hypothetical protein